MMPATTSSADVRKHKILFSDGRRGIQEEHMIDGEWKLSSIVVTVRADGSQCREVYAPRRYLDARVYSFGDLGNVTWKIND